MQAPELAGSLFATYGLGAPRLVGPWLPDQGSNMRLLHWKADS